MLKLLKQIRPIPIDFLNTFLKTGQLEPFFSKVVHTKSKKTIYLSETDHHSKFHNRHYLVFDVPGYLDTRTSAQVGIRKTNSFKGSLINFSKHTSFDNFFTSKFSSKRRTLLKSSEKKLMRSFNIHHKIFYGHITQDHYDYLFNEFRIMLKNRFLQKKVRNDDLPRWKHYHKIVLPLVLKKEACISVIYHDNKPISFSVNLLRGDTLYGYLKSYDTDFGKYSLGFLEMIKLFRWSFENKVGFFDLLKGQYEYKSKLIDEEYFFEKQVVYNGTSKRSKLFATFTIIRVRIFYTLIRSLKKIGVHLLYRRFNSMANHLKHKTVPKMGVMIQPLTSAIPESDLEKIDLKNDSYAFLRKPVYDYLFGHNLHIDHLQLCRIKDRPDRYILKDTNDTLIIICNS